MNLVCGRCNHTSVTAQKVCGVNWRFVIPARAGIQGQGALTARESHLSGLRHSQRAKLRQAPHEAVRTPPRARDEPGLLIK